MALFLSISAYYCVALCLQWFVLPLSSPHLMLPLLLLGVCRELWRVGVELPLGVTVDHVLVLHH